MLIMPSVCIRSPAHILPLDFTYLRVRVIILRVKVIKPQYVEGALSPQGFRVRCTPVRNDDKSETCTVLRICA